MLFTVQQLLEGHAAPVYISPVQTGSNALALMRQYDYSQLPVVEDDRLIGLVTSDSILRAASDFEVLLKNLHVEDAQLKPRAAALDTVMFNDSGPRDFFGNPKAGAAEHQP